MAAAGWLVLCDHSRVPRSRHGSKRAGSHGSCNMQPGHATCSYGIRHQPTFGSMQSSAWRSEAPQQARAPSKRRSNGRSVRACRSATPALNSSQTCAGMGAAVAAARARTADAAPLAMACRNAALWLLRRERAQQAERPLHESSKGSKWPPPTALTSCQSPMPQVRLGPLRALLESLPRALVGGLGGCAARGAEGRIPQRRFAHSGAAILKTKGLVEPADAS